jgi:hypothetical protein
MLISEYRRFIVSWVSAISTREPEVAMIAMPAICPADVRFVREIITDTSAGIPRFAAAIPKPKETER